MNHQPESNIHSKLDSHSCKPSKHGGKQSKKIAAKIATSGSQAPDPGKRRSKQAIAMKKSRPNQIPILEHEDGIFRIRQEQSFGQICLVEQALKVLEDYRESERKRVETLRTPVTRVIGLPRKVIRRQMERSAGEIKFAPTQLHGFSTREEHHAAECLHAFFEHPMPVYSSENACEQYHAKYCWKMALLNAYRILDLLEADEVPLPYGWEKIVVNRQKKNFGTLLASAALLLARRPSTSPNPGFVGFGEFRASIACLVGSVGKVNKSLCKLLIIEAGIVQS